MKPQVSIIEIDAILPQTQCQQCGFKGCYPYAEAIAQGNADINQCPPNGTEGIKQLASLLNVAEKPLNPEFGQEKSFQIAFIIEVDCIGCTKCLPPCPVDAIIGANKYMHTVISGECTGCELCVEPCPVDCIVMKPVDRLWGQDNANQARMAYQNKQQRLVIQTEQKAERLKKQKQTLAKLQL